MADSGAGQHRIWGAIEDMGSNSSSSINSVADDRPAYSAVQMKEHLKYLRERKPGGQESCTPGSENSPQQVVQQRGSAPAAGAQFLGSPQVAPRHGDFMVFTEKRGAGFPRSAGDSDCWDVDGALKGMAAGGLVDGMPAAPGHEVSMARLPSAGSAAHVVGTCRPCHYVHTQVGCEKGGNCGFCHYKHPKRRKPRPAKEVVHVDRARGAGDAGDYSSDEGADTDFPVQAYAPAPPSPADLRGPHLAPPGPPQLDHSWYGGGARLDRNHMLLSL